METIAWILLILGIITFIISAYTIKINVLILGIFLMCCGAALLIHEIISNSNIQLSVILPPEYTPTKGDTLIVEFVKDDKVYLMYP